jgi:hypothetical protein
MQAEEETPESQAKPNGNTAAKAPRRWSKTPSDYPLPSERTPFATHFEVLRRFMSMTGNGTRPVPAAAVEGGSVPTQAAQLNSGFLCDIGLLDEPIRGSFKPTPDAVSFMTLRTAGEDRARPVLRRLVDKSWFGKAAQSIFSTKPNVTEEELVMELGAVARTDMTKKEKSVRVLVEYLKLAGIVVKTSQGLAITTPEGFLAPQSTGPFLMPQVGALTATMTTTAANDPAQAGAIAANMNGPSGTGQVAVMAAGWETIQRNDFYLRVRRSPATLEQVKRQILVLEEELKAEEANRNPPFKPTTPTDDSRPKDGEA